MIKNLLTERYTTWKDAEQGHKRILEKIKAGTFLNGKKRLTLNLKQK